MAVTVADAQGIANRLRAEGRSPTEVLMGTRSEVHALLQLENPPPGEEDVTDEHRIAFANDRTHAASTIVPVGGYRTSPAHHWLQKQHGLRLWQVTDELVKGAGL